MPNQATVFNPQTGERKAVNVGDPNAFAGGFQLEQNAPAQPSQPQPKPQPESYPEWVNMAYEDPDYYYSLLGKEPGYAASQSSKYQQEDPMLKTLIGERSRHISDLYSKPFEADYADIFDPNMRRQLITQAVGNVMGQLSGTQEFITQRQGQADQKAQKDLELLQTQIQAAGIGMQARQDEAKRQAELEDYFTKYTGKLEIDRALGIGDFKPTTGAGDKTSIGTYTDKFTGQAYKTQTNFTTGETQYVPVGEPQPTDFSTGFNRWLGEMSTTYQMSFEPTSPDVRNTFASQYEPPLTYAQEQQGDFDQSLRDAISDIRNGADKGDTMDILIDLFPTEANSIESAFNLI